MKIGIINSYQSFKGNYDNFESFMGKVSDVFDSTTKASNDITDIVGSARNVFKTPEEATIGILTGQIEDKVVNNKKAPNWLRKAATYGAAALAAGGAIIGAQKAPGFIKNFIVRNLSKFNMGKKLLDRVSSAKTTLTKAVNSLGKEKIKDVIRNVGNYLSKKFPKTVESLNKFSQKVKLDKLKKFTLKDYVKNIFAIIVGYQTGKKVLDRNQDNINIEDKKPDDESFESEDDFEFREAA